MQAEPTERSPAELLQELQTHQVELEMQNLQLRETQSLLDASNQKYRELFDHAPVAHLIIDPQHAIEQANRAGARLIGLDRPGTALRPLAHYLTDDCRARFHQHIDSVLSTGVAASVHLSLANVQGDRVVHLLASSARLQGAPDMPARVLMTALDVTAELVAQSQQREMEQQLRTAQKMESLGRMAGGMAHDFNNLLHAIAGFADLASHDTDLEQIRESLTHIRNTAKRAARLTQQILAFSRRQPSLPVAVNLDELLMELSPVLQRLLRTGIRIQMDPSPNLPKAWIDKGQLEQVIVNLVVNAVDAIEQSGEIVLSTRYVPAPAHNLFGSADAVAIEVTDTGTGLSRDVLEHLFEPFFTTKPKGRGTGLGLSVVHGIVSQHGGLVRAENQPAGGARFTVQLPLAPASAGVPAGLSDAPAEDGHGEFILVVEDEQVLRELCARILTSHGYQVVTAFDGQDALEIYRKYTSERVSLIVMDVVMPRLGGVDAYRAMQAEGECPPVLFVSGFVGDADLQPVIQNHNGFLAKPFGEDALLQAIRRCLQDASVLTPAAAAAPVPPPGLPPDGR